MNHLADEVAEVIDQEVRQVANALQLAPAREILERVEVARNVAENSEQERDLTAMMHSVDGRVIHQFAQRQDPTVTADIVFDSPSKSFVVQR